MAEPATEYVRSLIRGIPWSARESLDSVRELERALLAGRNVGWAYGGFVLPGLIARNYRHYVAICDELTPGWREAAVRKVEEREAKAKRAHFEEKRERIARWRSQFEAEVAAWKRNGGVLDERPEPRKPWPLDHLSDAEEEAHWAKKPWAAPWIERRAGDGPGAPPELKDRWPSRDDAE